MPPRMRQALTVPGASVLYSCRVSLKERPGGRRLLADAGGHGRGERIGGEGRLRGASSACFFFNHFVVRISS